MHFVVKVYLWGTNLLAYPISSDWVSNFLTKGTPIQHFCQIFKKIISFATKAFRFKLIYS